MKKDAIIKAIIKGLIATISLLLVYFIILTLISGWGFAKVQFFDFWYFVISLAVGFGIQIGLYVYLKNMIRSRDLPRGMLVTTGSTSTLSMVSCCAHYLVNILPLIGVTGFITVVAQYQIELFWVGIGFNLFGIIFIANKVYKFSKQIKS